MAKKTVSTRKTKTKKVVRKSSANTKMMSNSPMAMSMAKSQSSSTGMSAQQLTVMFVLFFVAHSLIVYVGSMLFPTNIVLGTHVLSQLMAVLYSMFVFTLITVGATPVIEAVSRMSGMKLSDMHWMVLYLVVNTLGLWTVARFAEMLGMGLSSWMVAVVLAVIMDVVQGVIVKSMTSKA